MPTVMTLPAIKYAATAGSVGSVMVALKQWRRATEATKSLADTEQRLSVASEEAARLKSRLVRSEGQVKELVASEASVKADLEALELRLSRETEARARAEGENVARREQLQAMKHEAEDALSQVKEELLSKETSAKAALQEVSKLSTAISSKTRELDAAEAQRYEATSELASVKATLESLREGLSAKEAELCSIEEGTSELSCQLNSQLNTAFVMCGELIAKQEALAQRMGTAWATLEEELAAEKASIEGTFRAAKEVSTLASLRERLVTLKQQADSAQANQARAQLAFRLAKLGNGSSTLDYLRVVFEAIDNDSSGEISLDEFRQAIGDSGFACAVDQTEGCISAEEVEQLFRKIDIDCSGQICYNEFLGAKQDDILPKWLLSNEWVKEQVENQRLKQMEEALQFRVASLNTYLSALNATKAQLPAAEAAEAPIRASYEAELEDFAAKCTARTEAVEQEVGSRASLLEVREQLTLCRDLNQTIFRPMATLTLQEAGRIESFTPNL
eukprot:CAMPEP_0119310740 /NCGR_PEP_ID=MMETSP1333-20130426/19964_1 /TAXON_ID=418940 /ORGANISM="Scyphosphaera apsteinii, Strain RCC1455" /LENGTH=505 /DNA_ID=CAMNT_0007314979 /DNA_START=102 /DNA_END=1619 /DNA_ORIENTATION=-